MFPLLRNQSVCTRGSQRISLFNPHRFAPQIRPSQYSIPLHKQSSQIISTHAFPSQITHYNSGGHRTIASPFLRGIRANPFRHRSFSDASNPPNPTPAATSKPTKKTRRLKKKAPGTGGAAAMGSRKASDIENIAATQPIQRKYRYFSPRTATTVAVLWLVVSFVCLGWIYYYGVPPSRLMYVQPFLLNINPERSHLLAVKIAQWPRWARRVLGMCNNPDMDPHNAVKIWGIKFPNPIGLAAGFDKHGECVDGMLEMGFGFVEVGTITPEPQLGNPKPRVFRLLKDRAVINRYGFNSHGHNVVKDRLEARIQNMDRSIGKLGVNLGKNKNSESAVDDYVKGAEKFVDIADYLVINVSSPNTPGLRDLQRREELTNLLSTVKQARDEAHNKAFTASLMAECDACKPPPPPLLVKIAPDLSDSQLIDIAHVAKAVGIDGIIVTNTTVSRPDSLTHKHKSETGGLSGAPIFDISTEVLKKMYVLTNGEIPLIGVGGVSDAKQAYQKIISGASLVQLYTGLALSGPVLMKRMLRELNQYAELDGFDYIYEAIGSQIRREAGMPQKPKLSAEEEELMLELPPRRPKQSYFAKVFGLLHLPHPDLKQ